MALVAWVCLQLRGALFSGLIMSSWSNREGLKFLEELSSMLRSIENLMVQLES